MSGLNKELINETLKYIGSLPPSSSPPPPPPSLDTADKIVDYIKGAGVGTDPYKYMELALYNLARIDAKVSPGVAAAAGAPPSDMVKYNAAVGVLTDGTSGIKHGLPSDNIKAQLQILLPALTDNDAQETVVTYLQELTEDKIANLFNNKLTGPDAPVVSGGRRRRKSRKSRKARKSRRSRRARRSRRSRRARMMV
jgi:hypothetical protein